MEGREREREGERRGETGAEFQLNKNSAYALSNEHRANTL